MIQNYSTCSINIRSYEMSNFIFYNVLISPDKSCSPCWFPLVFSNWEIYKIYYFSLLLTCWNKISPWISTPNAVKRKLTWVHFVGNMAMKPQDSFQTNDPYTYSQRQCPGWLHKDCPFLSYFPLANTPLAESFDSEAGFLFAGKRRTLAAEGRTITRSITRHNYDPVFCSFRSGRHLAEIWDFIKLSSEQVHTNNQIWKYV